MAVVIRLMSDKIQCELCNTTMTARDEDDWLIMNMFAIRSVLFDAGGVGAGWPDRAYY